MRQLTLEEVQKMDFETAKNELSNRLYGAAILLETMENAGLVHGNGHHMAQEVVAAGVAVLTRSWLTKPKVTSSAG